MVQPLLPQLAQNANPKSLERYLSDEWVFQQKFDGVRMVLIIEDNEVTGWNRKGDLQTHVHNEIADYLAQLNGRWCLDSELVGGVMWVFDLPEAGAAVTNRTPYADRLIALETLVNKTGLKDMSKLKLVTTARTRQEKLDLLQRSQEAHSEGIMIKRLDAPYAAGLRSPYCLKLKFWKTVDVVVLQVGREGKRSIAVGLYDNGKLVDVGACTITEKMLTVLQKGDVCELKYLYATADRRIYQPAFLRQRTDKAPNECLIDQLELTDKTTIHS